jgi:hypothetical protein
VIRTEIEPTEEQDRRLEELSAARHVPKEELVRQAVDILLARSVLPPPSVVTEEQRQRAIAMVGRFSLGASDVAENHDKYLAEMYDHDNAWRPRDDIEATPHRRADMCSTALDARG